MSFLRFLAIVSIVSICTSTGKSTHGQLPPTVESLAWSPDGSLVAVGWSDGRLQFVDSLTEEIADTIEIVGSKTITSLDWSPDGRNIALGSLAGAVYVWDVSMQRIAAELITGDVAVSSVSWSADGSMIASANQTDAPMSQTFDVHVWDTTTFELLNIWSFATPVASVAWSPAGPYLAISGDQEDPAMVVDVSVWEPMVEFDTQSEYVDLVFWHPDGDKVCLVVRHFDIDSITHSLEIWSTPSGTLLQTYQLGFIVDAAWRPDGRHIAVSMRDKILIVDANTGATLHAISHDEIFAEAVAWSPNGEKLVYGLGSGAYFARIDLPS